MLATQDTFAIPSRAKNLLHRCIGTHARVHVHFLRRVWMHFDSCCEHHACAGVYVKQKLWTSAYTFAYTLATGFAHALMYVNFVHSALGNEDGGVQLVYEGTCCLAWGDIFDRRRDRSVVCAVGVYVGAGMCIYSHAHTHCTYGVLGCEPRGRDEIPGGPEESKSMKLSEWMYSYKSTHVYVHARRRDEILG